MRNARRTGSGVAALLVRLVLGGGTVLAHEGGAGTESLAVEPSSVTAGGSVVLAGSGLEPENERVLVLAGQGLVVEFGTVTTEAEGMFSKELAIPSDLPAGTYELRAIGDETLTAPLALTAADGAAGAPGPDAAAQAVVPRDRSPIELALLVGVVAILAAIGGLLVWRAERFRGDVGSLHTTT